MSLGYLCSRGIKVCVFITLIARIFIRGPFEKLRVIKYQLGSIFDFSEIITPYFNLTSRKNQ